MSIFRFPLGIIPPLLYHIPRGSCVSIYANLHTPRGPLCSRLYYFTRPYGQMYPPNPFRLEHQPRLQTPLAQFSKQLILPHPGSLLRTGLWTAQKPYGRAPTLYLSSNNGGWGWQAEIVLQGPPAPSSSHQPLSLVGCGPGLASSAGHRSSTFLRLALTG